MRYDIVLSESAKTDLRAVFEYIAYVLQVPKAARSTVRKILSEIEKLDEMPERYRFYPEPLIAQQEIRFFPVANYLVFYKVSKEKNMVFVSRVIYGGRDIKNQLIETDVWCPNDSTNR